MQGTLFSTDEPDPWEADELRDRLVAEVVFAEAPYGPFDYAVPESLRECVEPGRRVRVPLGKGQRAVVGYCIGCASGRTVTRTLKDVIGVVDAGPLVAPEMLELARWIADYYVCELGTVLESMIPAGVRAQAGTREQVFLSLSDQAAAELAAAELAKGKLPAKQRKVLEVLQAASRPMTAAELAEAAGCTSAPIQNLRRKGLLVDDVRRVLRAADERAAEAREEALHLNADQQAALDAVTAAIAQDRHEAVLLHGVTGSGKTEVYIRAIEEVVARQGQAIVLVPEISLTPQTRQRFRARFPQVAVLHSHLTDSERNWHWQRIARGEVQVIVGARSAVFAPAPRLGLIVIDEEHDGSFKQDTAPRYHAREVALRRARSLAIPVVLGSATPSLDSWRRAELGEFRLVEMPRRVSGRPLPPVTTVDLRDEFRRGKSRGPISGPLWQSLRETLAAGGQAILLLNRRGFSTSIQCPACGYVARCPDCDLALTLHRADGRAVCHYCDFEIPAPERCPHCRFEGIRFAGLGTERLEEELRERLPDVPVMRMDSDTMRRPGSHEAALTRFRNGEARVLVGTQMIAKGLDFPNVTLVGVINADTALHFPDFRAAERTFQLVTQVAGRTGRGERGGHVIVQTFSPDNPAIMAAARHDYAAFAAGELPGRGALGYPPFGTLVRVIVRGPVLSATEAFAAQWVEWIQASVRERSLDARILGPAACPLARLRGKHRFHAFFYASDGVRLREAIRETVGRLDPPRGVQWLIDVDPLDML